MEPSIAPFRIEKRSNTRSVQFARPALQADLTVLVMAGLSGLFYVLVHLTQQSLFGSGPAVVPWEDPASHPRFFGLLSVYTIAALALVALHARVVTWSRSVPLNARTWGLALSLPLLFHLGFLFSLPAFSPDVYTYAAYGYIGTLPNGNAYYQEARTITGTAFGMELSSLGWSGSGLSPYGPIWNDLEVAIVRATPHAFQAVVLSKAIVVVATFGSALLVFSILRSIRPAARFTGTVAFLWNPLLVLLLAGEGHNEGLVILLVLAALALSVQRRVASGVVLQVLAVLTKYLPVVLLPVQVAFWFRTETNRPRMALRLGLVGLLGLGVTVLLYQPVWLGISTFMGTGLLGSGTSAESASDLVGGLERLGRYAVIAGAVLIGAWRAHDANRLLSSCAGVIFVVVLAGPQQFWPWYATLPIALMVLTPSDLFRWSSLVLMVCSLVASPLDELSLSGRLIFPEIQGLALHVTRILPLLTFFGLASVGALSRFNPFRLPSGIRPFKPG